MKNGGWLFVDKQEATTFEIGRIVWNVGEKCMSPAKRWEVEMKVWMVRDEDSFKDVSLEY